MQPCKVIGFLIVGIVVLFCIIHLPAKNATYSNELPVVYEAKNGIGKYPSLNGKCVASFHVHEMGGFNVLTITHKSADKNGNDKFTVNDVSGIVWFGKNELAYTTSPIYGKPGIFKFDCLKFKTHQLVSPRTYNKYYPDGIDFFELKSVINGDKGIIQFYYSPNVKETDFTIFRTNEFLYQVNMDGTGFKKVRLE
jgi:hypothetical protein